MREFTTVFFIMLYITVYCQIRSPNDTLQLTFEEVFSSDSSVAQNWDFRYPWGLTLWGAKHVELQWYTKRNVIIDSAGLHIIAKQENSTNKVVSWFPDDTLLGDLQPNIRTLNYTSGIIYSKQTFGYGFYEISSKMPQGAGFWPCFWLWSPKGEIDICEPNGKLSIDATSYGASFHYPKGAKGQTITMPFNFSETYNTYAVLWTKNSIIWYCNDSIVRSVTDTLVPSTKLAIIANLAIDPFYKPNETSLFPQQFDIQYIRYYAIKEEAF